MSKEGISTMIGATNSVILKELIKEKDQKLAALQSKVEQLEKLYKKMIFTTKGKHANNDSIQMMLIRGHLDDMAKILEQR